MRFCIKRLLTAGFMFLKSWSLNFKQLSSTEFDESLFDEHNLGLPQFNEHNLMLGFVMVKFSTLVHYSARKRMMYCCLKFTIVFVNCDVAYLFSKFFAHNYITLMIY